MPNQESEFRYSRYSREELEKLLERGLSSQEEKLILAELSNRFKKELLDKVKPPKPSSAGCFIWTILIIGIMITATIPEVRCLLGLQSESCPSLPKPSPPNSFEQLGTTLISKATGVDYTRLRDLLAEGKWKEADLETGRTMLQAANRESEGWLRREDVEKFSCEDLRIIDQLWVSASGGKFGFSVQKEIWKKLERSTDSAPIKTWRKFYIDVGWKPEGSGTQSSSGYVSYDDLEGFKDIRSASAGNLPWLPEIGIGVGPHSGRWGSTIFSRTTFCNL